MAWSWTVVESGWISPSQKDLTPQPRESTWGDPRMAEAVLVDPGAIHVTTTVDTTAATIEAAMIATTRGNTTDHTDEDLHHLTTEEHTDLGQDPGLILLVDIEQFRQTRIPRFHGQTRRSS